MTGMTGYIWNMKRRNIECGKMRRPLKKSKLSEGLYGSAFLYMKFLLVWSLVMVADFILEFRFEYLWPFWLLLRSVFDSFRYQGLAFSVLFVCIAVTSDVVCYIFVPVQWLFFAASTYVWVQYVWHTDRGICLPTVSLWLLFVYIEASLRLKDFRCAPFHLDLCRPFAAHCIGYPVVTLGFGFKSYVSYKLRLRKQKEVQKENEFYAQLLQQALPAELVQYSDSIKGLPTKSQEDLVSNGTVTVSPSTTECNGTNRKTPSTSSLDVAGGSSISTTTSSKDLIGDSLDSYEFIEQQQQQQQQLRHRQSINDFKEENVTNEQQNAKVFKSTAMASRNGIQLSATPPVKDNVVTATALMSGRKAKSTNTAAASSSTTAFVNNKDEVLTRLESDVKRLKSDLQSSRNCEQELRYQINLLTTGDKTMKTEMAQLRQDNDSLQSKLHNLVTSRQQDKQTLTTLERKLADERKQRASVEQQLAAERKKKAEDSAAAKTLALTAQTRSECTDTCKARRRDLEAEVKQISWDLKRKEDQIHQLEYETKVLRQYKDSQADAEVLMSALSAMQEKTAHLENSLSAETRLKLDLFSALGEAKRQVEIQQSQLRQKEAEIADLKMKIAEVMALVPSTSGFGSLCTDSAPHFSGAFTTPVSCDSVEYSPHAAAARSNLNPHASDYLPKLGQ